MEQKWLRGRSSYSSPSPLAGQRLVNQDLSNYSFWQETEVK